MNSTPSLITTLMAHIVRSLPSIRPSLQHLYIKQWFGDCSPLLFTLLSSDSSLFRFVVLLVIGSDTKPKMKCGKSVCHPRSVASLTLLSVSLILISLISIISSETIAKSADYDSDNELETIDSNSDSDIRSPVKQK